jgi:hypothetical protein
VSKDTHTHGGVEKHQLGELLPLGERGEDSFEEQGKSKYNFEKDFTKNVAQMSYCKQDIDQEYHV